MLVGSLRRRHAAATAGWLFGLRRGHCCSRRRRCVYCCGRGRARRSAAGLSRGWLRNLRIDRLSDSDSLSRPPSSPSLSSAAAVALAASASARGGVRTTALGRAGSEATSRSDLLRRSPSPSSSFLRRRRSRRSGSSCRVRLRPRRVRLRSRLCFSFFSRFCAMTCGKQWGCDSNTYYRAENS